MDKTSPYTRVEVSRAWWATAGIFLIHGLIVSTWVARIPAIKAGLHLSDGVLGITLLWTAIGAVVCIPVTGFALTRFGPARVCVLSTLLFCLSLIPLAFAPNAPVLGVSLFVFGALAAAMDVSMNAHGVAVEKALGHPTMSRFHGMFSLGGMVGAGIGGMLAAKGWSPGFHFAFAAGLFVAGTLAFWPMLLQHCETQREGEHRLPIRQIPPVLFAISAIGFCILLSEGAIADWTAVYLRQNLQAGPALAAAGYSVFSATMAVFRFLGDWITAKLGPARTVLSGTLLAGLGMTWAALAPTARLSLPGFGIVGAGFSVIIPLVFGSGGRIKGVDPGAGIATVTGLGYVGFIVGPPTIGLLAEWITLRGALGFVVACCVLSAGLSFTLRKLDASARTPSFRDIQPHV